MLALSRVLLSRCMLRIHSSASHRQRCAGHFMDSVTTVAALMSLKCPEQSLSPSTVQSQSESPCIQGRKSVIRTTRTPPPRCFCMFELRGQRNAMVFRTCLPWGACPFSSGPDPTAAVLRAGGPGGHTHNLTTTVRK